MANRDEYVANKLTPILNDMVAHCLREMPDDPRAWMEKYLTEGAGGAALAGNLDVTKKTTAPIPGQKPGTSGLRKKTKTFMEGNYLHNFVQSVFNACKESGVPLEGGTLVVSGDGRYWNKDAIQIIIKMAFANGVKRVWCATDGLLSTPATSAVIRYKGKGFEPFGGFICSASHNPGGIDEDFGIKYNCENGGPAPEKMTDIMVTQTETLAEYLICEGVPTIDLSKSATYTIGDRTVEVFDTVEDHEKKLRECFDFDLIKKLFARDDFSMCYDSMCGVQSPYAKAILEGSLGAKPGSCINAEAREDFGGKESEWHGHADPNLTYAVVLVRTMGLNAKGEKIETPVPPPVFGAAADGDADRNMIMGSQFFVSPSDSLDEVLVDVKSSLETLKRTVLRLSCSTAGLDSRVADLSDKIDNERRDRASGDQEWLKRLAEERAARQQQDQALASEVSRLREEAVEESTGRKAADRAADRNIQDVRKALQRLERETENWLSQEQERWRAIEELRDLATAENSRREAADGDLRQFGQTAFQEVDGWWRRYAAAGA